MQFHITVSIDKLKFVGQRQVDRESVRVPINRHYCSVREGRALNEMIERAMQFTAEAQRTQR
jgi:hypothetical protein